MDISTLQQQIDAANKAYWLQHQPIMPDDAYDRLIEQLRILAPEDPRLHYVGGAIGTIEHNPPMLSLDKCYNYSVLLEWCTKVARSEQERFLIQPKYDGIAAKLVSRYGQLQLSTRGDGHRGENITDKLKCIKLVSRDEQVARIWVNPSVAELQLYGELVITNSDFELYCKSGRCLRQDGEKYTSPRNGVAGMVALKALPGITGDKPITLVDYHQYEQQLTLVELRNSNNWNRIIEEVQQLGYPVDGIVIKLADPTLAEQLGCTQHHPRAAMAFKFVNESAMSKITSIDWNVGLSSITPIANIEPVTINQTTISRATLFNLAYVIKHNFHVGDDVMIERAGDVIPHLSSENHVVNTTDKLAIPTHCPSCGAKVYQRGVELVCDNPNCAGKLLAQLVKATKELGLDGFGKVILTKLIQHGITQLDQLLAVTVDQLLSYGYGERTANNLATSLAQVRTTLTPAQLLAACCIPGISRTTAASLLVTCTLPELVAATPDQLQAWYQTQGERGQALVQWLTDPNNVLKLTKCMVLCTNLATLPNTCEPTVCFTGKLSKPRSAMLEYAKAKGYRTTDAVTRSLDILVVPDNNPTTSDKLTKAKRYGIQILTETQFYNQ